MLGGPDGLNKGFYMMMDELPRYDPKSESVLFINRLNSGNFGIFDPDEFNTNVNS